MPNLILEPSNIIGYDFPLVDTPVELPLNLDALDGSPQSFTLIFELEPSDTPMSDLSDKNIVNPISRVLFQSTVSKSAGVVVCKPFINLNGVEYFHPDIIFTSAFGGLNAIWPFDPSRNKEWFLANVLGLSFGMNITLINTTDAVLQSTKGYVAYTENGNLLVPKKADLTHTLELQGSSSIIINKENP